VGALPDARPVAPGHSLVYTIDQRRLCAHLEAIRAHRGEPVLGVAPAPVLLTFDDGSAGCHQYAAPALEAMGWRGYFFITTDWIGRPGIMNALQIAELHRRGHVIGSHSASHPERMSQLPWAALLDEWQTSRRVLEAITGAPVAAASVPGGYSSPEVIRAAAAAGIRLLFTSKPACTSRTVDGCRVCGRYSMSAATRPAVCGAIAGGYLLPRSRELWWWWIKETVKAVGGSYYPRFRRRVLALQGRL
jgi:peptidoglycan/xylan/chitin deacetylase (PgdA/CDA1 family)